MNQETDSRVRSEELCRRLRGVAASDEFALPAAWYRYQENDELDLGIVAVWPEAAGRVKLLVEKFVGGGFAGQVYRCRVLESDMAAGGPVAGLDVGACCAVKIFVPPSPGKKRFRDFLYRLAFQSPFMRSTNSNAAQAGALWQRLVKTLYEAEYGESGAICDVYATFHDDRSCSYGQICEWVDGRTWRLEPDTDFRARRRWKNCGLNETQSPEYVAKRRFMWRLVEFFRRLGATEFARQYEWWTAKSQPNVLKRRDAENSPAAGLCAVDFTPGLALLPFLPMSPADFRLIITGLCRGAAAQFDRIDFRELKAFVSDRRNADPGAAGMVALLEAYDSEYRAGQPDMWRRGFGCFVGRKNRIRARTGLTEGYIARKLVDGRFAAGLVDGPFRFAAFWCLGLVPVAASFLRRVWGNGSYRRYLRRLFVDAAFFRRACAARMSAVLWLWHRSGRTSADHVEFLESRPWLFWAERCTIGLLPACLHSLAAEPIRALKSIRAGWRWVLRFYRDSSFREDWLRNEVEQGYSEGMLTVEERDAVMKRVDEEFIAVYLKCLAVHFATLPVTQIVSVLTGAAVAVCMLIGGATWTSAMVAFGAVLLTFQVIPISPGSLCRGAYVVYLMRKERNYRDYLIAAPLSFVKYIGYLAFPIQMVARYPVLSRFMAARWAARSAHVVPVFGEKGALLEHMVFDMFFNVPRVVGKWAGRRPAELLSIWMLMGTMSVWAISGGCDVRWSETGGINLLVAYLALFAAPRLVFYPILRRRTGRQLGRGPEAGGRAGI